MKVTWIKITLLLNEIYAKYTHGQSSLSIWDLSLCMWVLKYSGLRIAHALGNKIPKIFGMIVLKFERKRVFIYNGVLYAALDIIPSKEVLTSVGRT